MGNYNSIYARRLGAAGFTAAEGGGSDGSSSGRGRSQVSQHVASICGAVQGLAALEVTQQILVVLPPAASASSSALIMLCCPAAVHKKRGDDESCGRTWRCEFGAGKGEREGQQQLDRQLLADLVPHADLPPPILSVPFDLARQCRLLLYGCSPRARDPSDSSRSIRLVMAIPTTLHATAAPF
jgi:hypothetical protein